jgi:hypothetical protein
MAVCHGLVDKLGNDRVLAAIGAGLQRGEEDREVVPDEIVIEEKAWAKTANGRDSVNRRPKLTPRIGSPENVTEEGCRT